MIEFQKVIYSRGEHTILDIPALTLQERRIGIVGANGSGKSTFARLLNGLLVPTEGTVSVNGLDTQQAGKEVRKKVGFVFSNPEHQIVFPIVEEDLAFGLKNLSLTLQEIEDRIDTILAAYNLSHLKHHKIHTLSGGEKQLIALAGVLIMEPEYIILDEPTTFLDLRNKLKIQQAIYDLPQKAIVVSHDLKLLNNFDRILVFDNGKIITDEIPKNALAVYQNKFA